MDGDVVADEGDDRRLERILGAELETQLEEFAVVQRPFRSTQLHDPLLFLGKTAKQAPASAAAASEGERQ